MGTLKPNQLKAISYYAEAHNLKLALSAPPSIYFKDARGKEIVRNILTVILEYKRAKKETQYGKEVQDRVTNKVRR